ncbi:response regulator transcription factor [Glycomyces tarimensis]
MLYVQAPEAEQKISDCANRMGLCEAVKTVDCVPALFMELRRRPVDVILVDVALAAPDPVEFARAVHSRFPRTGVVFSGAADPRTAAAVAAAGALGVMRALSGDADDVLVAFAQAIMCSRQSRTDPTAAVPKQRSAGAAEAPLSPREFQVLAGISQGKPNAEIGHDLFVSEDTVKTHAKRMYRKLGARDRAHAVAIALRAGMIA